MDFIQVETKVPGADSTGFYIDAMSRSCDWRITALFLWAAARVHHTSTNTKTAP